MGSVVHAVGHTVSSAAKGVSNVVSAPVHVVSDIANGHNVFESIGKGVVQGVAGLQAPTLGIAHSVSPVIGKIPIAGSLLQQNIDSGDAINQSGNVTRGQAITFTRTSAELTGAAYGGSLLGSAITAGTITPGQAAIGGLTGLGAISRGNLAGALDSAGSLAGDGTVGDSLTTAGDFVNAVAPSSPTGPRPSSSGVLVLPQAVSGVTGYSGVSDSLTGSPVVTVAVAAAAGLVLLILFKKGLKHGR